MIKSVAIWLKHKDKRNVLLVSKERVALMCSEICRQTTRPDRLQGQWLGQCSECFNVGSFVTRVREMMSVTTGR